VHSASVLGKYPVRYLQCESCELLQTEDPYWLDEAYELPINTLDTGILQRNIRFSRVVASVAFSLFDREDTFVDFAGGYGILTRLLRDMGFDFYWHDPYTQNLVARGFEWDGEVRAALLTASEVFEHFVNPRAELDKMLAIGTSILFTTILVPNPIPDPSSWWYYGLEHGQHVSFYTKKTLQFLAEIHELQLYSHRNVHLLTPKRLATRRGPLRELIAGPGRRIARRSRLVLSRMSGDFGWLVANADVYWRSIVRPAIKSRTQSDMTLLQERVSSSRQDQNQI
jgi:hypothetical protein